MKQAVLTEILSLTTKYQFSVFLYDKTTPFRFSAVINETKFDDKRGRFVQKATRSTNKNPVIFIFAR